MLGRPRRTTRLDVGLALAFAGIAYLIWALVAGISRESVQELLAIVSQREELAMPRPARVVKILFSDAGFAIDLVGLAWLAGSLLLVVFSSRQRVSISWAWVSATCQSFVAALGAVLVGWASQQPYRSLLVDDPQRSPWEMISGFSLPVALVAALLIWVAFLVWLLVEGARLGRRGPSLRDGLRSNVYKS